MPFCAHCWLVLSRLLPPLPVFCPWIYTPVTEDLTEKVRTAGGSSSPAHPRAMADTTALVCRFPAWTAPSTISNTALGATWPSSTEYFRHSSVQAGTMSPAQNNRIALTSLLHWQCFPKAEGPKREHNKLLIESSKWPLLWLFSFIIASNLFFCMCCISDWNAEQLSAFYAGEATMLLWLHCFLHKYALYSIYMFHKKLGSEVF